MADGQDACSKRACGKYTEQLQQQVEVVGASAKSRCKSICLLPAPRCNVVLEAAAASPMVTALTDGDRQLEQDVQCAAQVVWRHLRQVQRRGLCGKADANTLHKATNNQLCHC